MKTAMRNLTFAAFAAVALFTLSAHAATGDLIARYDLNVEGYVVTDPDIFAGLQPYSTAISIPKGVSMGLSIPNVLKDRPGHPYTLVLKIKTQIEDGWVCLANMPETNDTDAMIYLDKTDRKVHIKQFDKTRDSAVSSMGVELNCWTTLAFAFGENSTEIYLNGERIFSGTGALAGSYADCYSAGSNIRIGADNDGDDNLFYLADARIYDGAVAVSDELSGTGSKNDPFLITSNGDWWLFVDNVNRGMAPGRAYPYYRLVTDLGYHLFSMSDSVGTGLHHFHGDFDGDHHSINFRISGSDPGLAPFARTYNASIRNLIVTGSVSSTANHAAGLIGICSGTTTIEHCTVATTVSVSGADYVGGIIGHARSGTISIDDCAFSGDLSGFSAHAGGLIGWCDSLSNLSLGNCLFSGTFNGSGKVTPFLCKSSGSTVPVTLTGGIYYQNTVTSTEDAAHLIPDIEGAPVNATLIPGEWGKPVRIAAANVYYARSPVVEIPSSGTLKLYDGDVLTGTVGPDTRVNIDFGAMVVLRDVNITSIPDDEDHQFAGITCPGNATIFLQGKNVVRGGYTSVPGIRVYQYDTLIIRGDGSLDVSSNGYAAGIGGGYGSSCGSIIIEGGTITATGGQGAAGIGTGSGGTSGDITITGGTVTATGGQGGAGIGGSYQANCGNITISGGTVTATGGQYAPGIGGGASGECGNIIIEEFVTRVTADGGDLSPSSVGAGYQGTCGTVTIGGEETGDIQIGHYVYDPCITTIASSAAWNVFASRVNRGLNTYSGLTVTLAADITVTTTVGTLNHPFCGTFNGNGHTLTVNINGSERGTAPFSHISGATISNLTVAGTVTSSGYHTSGLVGICDGVCAILGCIVTADVNADNYAGGIVGHGGNDTLTITDSVYSGTISGFTYFAGGFLGWCDDLTLTMNNCLFTGAFSPFDTGRFHPIACKNGGSAVAATVARIYHLNTITPSDLGGNLIPGTDGEPVSATYVAGEWTLPLMAADGHVYYRSALDIAIGSTAEWDAFAMDVNDGVEDYFGTILTLTADITVTTTVGTPDHPFRGAFNGNGHTLTVGISGSESGMAPFRAIDGATILNLNVSGTVTSSEAHAAGLVGICGSNLPNAIKNCAVSVAVSAPNHAGGIVGHGGNGILAIEGCAFSGKISDFAYYAGGILGWCDAITLSISDCIVTGSFAPATSGRFHPIACKNYGSSVLAIATRAYFLNTITPTAKGNVLVPDADGEPVSAIYIADQWMEPVTAANGIVYYLKKKWNTVTLTSATGLVTLHDDDCLTGTGGPDTHVIIAANATVLFSGVGISEIPNDNNHMWAGVTSQGNATIILDEGTSSFVKSGYRYYSGIQPGPSGTTLTIRGSGSLEVWGGIRSAGIGSSQHTSCGDIAIQGGNITVYGGIERTYDEYGPITYVGESAGIGSSPNGVCGNITISGGNVSAVGGYSAGIGSAKGGSCGNITITGGTVYAASHGREGVAAGIGSAKGGSCGNITITANVDCVTANGGESAPYSIGAGLSDSEAASVCGTVTIGGVVTGNVAVGYYVYDPHLISSAADWDRFAALVNNGTDSYAGRTMRLGADITVTTMMGKEDHPFRGTFEGNRHTLTVNISGTETGVAPFRAIDGATIRNLNVTGTVTSSGNHAAGLVGCCANGNNILNCTVATDVKGSGGAGGIVGHGGSGSLILEDCVFSGTISGFSGHAGGLMGWCDDLTLAIRNCLIKGVFVPGESGKYHPVACKNDDSTVTATVTQTSYLNSNVPTETGGFLIPEADIAPVSETYIPGIWAKPFYAADYHYYYYQSPVVTLTSETEDVTLYDGDVLTGTGGPNTRVMIDGSARVTLRDVDITGIAARNSWAGITCLRSGVSIYLEGNNIVKGGGRADYPGVDLTDYSLSVFGPGTLTAIGQSGAPGIGPQKGRSCSSIRIFSGTIIATGGKYAAGIGGSWQGGCGMITLSGGIITATGGENAAGIGFGYEPNDTKLTLQICGYEPGWDIGITRVVATSGGRYAEAIGRSGVSHDLTGTIQMSNFDRNLVDSKDHILLINREIYRTRTLASSFTCIKEFAPDSFVTGRVTINDDPVSYYTDGDVALADGAVLTGTGGSDTYVVIQDGAAVTLQDAVVKHACWPGIICLGDATIILRGENRLRGGLYAPGIFVPEGKTLTIRGDGMLDVEGSSAAGIGGRDELPCGNIEIAGGTINAVGYGYSAGIGSGKNGSCGAITISGGYVEATGDSYAAGIGSGERGSCGNITITGGTVTAQGGFYAAGIGSGERGSCGAITISGGCVEATGGSMSAGIGGGKGDSFIQSVCGDIIIGLGVTSVTATHGDGGPNAIGAGISGTCGTVSVSDGLNDMTDGAIRTITVRPIRFAEWATAVGITGTWDAKDALGIPNIFRYAFGVTYGAFESPPLLSISFDADGNPVIHTPPLSPRVMGFEFGILATDGLDGSGAVTYPLNASGETVIPKTDKKARFFRLTVKEK